MNELEAFVAIAVIWWSVYFAFDAGGFILRRARRRNDERLVAQIRALCARESQDP